MHSKAQPISDRRGGTAFAYDTHWLQQQIERLKSRLRLAIIFGGNKSTPGSVIYESHNSRAWKSYEAVAEDVGATLRHLGFRHVQVIPEDMRLGERLRREAIHLAWLNSGGVQGYNPAAHAPAALEMLGIPYVGHDPLAATTLDNKHAFKREASCAGLPTAPFTTWHMDRGPFCPDANSRFHRAFGDYPGPFVVKPVSGRASLHVHLIEDRAGLPDAIAKVYRATGNVALVEKFLAGREVCIAVTGPLVARADRLVRRRDPFTFAALERVLAPGERIFTSMDVRPITAERVRSLDDVRDAKLVGRMQELAREVYREFNLSSLVRLDLRADEKGDLHILEANPKPDLKKPEQGVTNLISAGLPQVGMSYEDLVLSLLADRLDQLFTHRRAAAQHILDLLSSPSLSSSESFTLNNGSIRPVVHASDADGPADDGFARLSEVVADTNLLALEATLKNLRAANGAQESVEGSDKVNSSSTNSTDDLGSRMA
jgi:D-alanine-D-alanine ligase